MSYSEIKFKIADENPAGANDNDSLTVYRMVAEDPYDGTAFKAGATSFNVTNIPTGTGVIEWQDPSATDGVPYFYRFVFGRSSTSSTSAPSQLIGPLMLQGADSFGYPNNIPSHESGVPNYVDVEPLIHWDSTYEEAARGLNYVYSNTTSGAYQNQADTYNNINIRDGGVGETKIQTWIDTTGTDRGIPIMGRDGYTTAGNNLGTGIGGSVGDLVGPYAMDGVTVITVSAGGYNTSAFNYDTSNVSAGYQLALRWMRSRSHQMETFDSFMARQVDSSLPPTYKIPAWQIRDEELIQAGTIQRSAQRTGMIWNSDPNDERNASAIAWAPTNNHSGVWGHFYPLSGSMHPRVYCAAERTPTNSKAGYIDPDSLNLGVYRQDDLGTREWWWNGELIGYTDPLDTSTHYTLNMQATSAQNFMADHPNWTHVQDNLNANPGTSQPYVLRSAVGDLTTLSSNAFHMAFGWTEVLVFPKRLTGEMLLRAIAYVNQKWGTYMAPQSGHIGA